MDVSTLATPTLGEGVYTFSEAADILQRMDRPLTARQVRYWMLTGLVAPSHATRRGDPILSFDDLISLEIVARFRQVGTSLQRVRQLEAALRARFPGLVRPFAYRIFFTDGAAVWAQEIGEEGPIATELLGRHKNQRVWLDAIKTFATEVRFDSGNPAHAERWELSPWVEINPAVQFGAPVVRGTRVPVRTIAANLAEATPEQVADWYGLEVQQVEGVRDYLAVR